MSTEILLQTLLSGVLIGLVYALVAVGLTMIFGVMDIVNFAHGEFLMFGMYASFWLFSLYALDPLFTLPLTALLLFALGAAVYHIVIRRIIDAPMLSQIFTTFGLMILFRSRAIPVEARLSHRGKFLGIGQGRIRLAAVRHAAADRRRRRHRHHRRDL